MFDNAYEALSEESDDTRWAFGTGFEDPLAGIDTTVPSDVDAADLAAYCLMLGDDALILSHRLQQWCTNAPELEDEVALANIALDLLGQARLLLARAGKAEGKDRGEDELAYFRDSADFRNTRLVELDNGDFALSMARLLVFTTWRLALFQRLVSTKDQVLSAIAAKGVKELTYHRDYAAQWVVRLGDGTELSHRRMQAGLDAVWPSVAGLFTPEDVELRLAASGAGVDPAGLHTEFDDVIAQVLSAATLDWPSTVGSVDPGRGANSAELREILDELQVVARAHPEATW